MVIALYWASEGAVEHSWDNAGKIFSFDVLRVRE